MQKLPEDVSPESAAIFSVLEVHFVRKPIATNSQPFQLGEFSVHLSYQDQTGKECFQYNSGVLLGQHTLNVNLYSSLNISGLVANWAATSGNLDCIPLHESAFKALQP